MIDTAPRIVSADSQVPGWNWGDRSVADVKAAKYTPTDRDIAIMNERQAARLAMPQGIPVVGDYVVFADDVTRRVSNVMLFNPKHGGGAQTSDGGSWHINGSGDSSFSGSLRPPVWCDTLTVTDELRPAQFWFFHHGHTKAHNAVYVNINVRVWHCNLDAN